jgi:hypothetical protein
MKTYGLHKSSAFDCRIKLLAILLVQSAMILLVFSGCATIGKDFPDSKVSEIEIGMTTQDEIRTMFGSPWRIGIEDGQRTWTYGNYSYGLFVEKKAKDLVIRFNDKNVVASYTFSTTEHNE